MTEENLIFVSFEPNNGQFRAYIPMEEVFASQTELSKVLNKSVNVYYQSIKEMRSLIAEINSLRAHRQAVPASTVWLLGDFIFHLVDNLEKLGLQIDGMYNHLARDLNVKRKWLEKVIIFRRYLPTRNVIPDWLNWGKCEKGTRKVAEALWNGVAPDGYRPRSRNR